ncbi:hypothetical protein SLEP1_g19988 [Rubroshorea leprosula]|uniref:Uncharacterized protein n=1 Tax=Rubroshorea leprosula TaxID=152421 RepID=A0AAV5J6M7_9ROSI|nr:hypothetical protein SLEP1_g19988 [Rubroshorea leprosula]
MSCICTLSSIYTHLFCGPNQAFCNLDLFFLLLNNTSSPPILKLFSI